MRVKLSNKIFHFSVSEILPKSKSNMRLKTKVPQNKFLNIILKPRVAVYLKNLQQNKIKNSSMMILKYYVKALMHSC